MRKFPPLASVRVFEAAARHENFTLAAAELGMTQAAVSYQIKALEDRVGTALFLREKGRARLTPLGARLLPQLTQAFDVSTGRTDPRLAEVQRLLASRHVTAVRIDAGPGSNRVLYSAANNAPSVSRVTYTGGAQDDEFTANLNYGLNVGQEVRLVANGGAGNDKLTFNVGLPRPFSNTSGQIRDGASLIYGNFIPNTVRGSPRSGRAAVICDGGSAFWGIAYDPASGQFTELEFNGVT